MTARFRHDLRFYADETSLGLAEGLECFRRDLVYPGHRLIPQLQPGMDDEDWLPIVGQLGLVVITRDHKLRSRPSQRMLIVARHLRVVHLDFKNTGNWDALVLLVRSWEAMEAFIAAEGDVPWWLALGVGGMRRKTIADALPRHL